jgi:hypothetical protein
MIARAATPTRSQKERNMKHVYKVGQMLELIPAPMHSNRPKGPCKVLACLPHENGPVLYRVQCLSERNERVVEETDLVPGSRSNSASAVNKNFISIAITRR